MTHRIIWLVNVIDQINRTKSFLNLEFNQNSSLVTIHVAMDGLLTPVSIVYKNQEQKDEGALVEISTSSPLIQPANEAYSNPIHISSIEEAFKTLKSQPSFEDLSAVLLFLDEETAFSITSPGPLASQLVNVLVSEVIPNYWSILNESRGNARKTKQSHTFKLLLNSIRSITGINAILLNLKRLTQQSKETSKNIGGEPPKD